MSDYLLALALENPQSWHAEQAEAAQAAKQTQTEPTATQAPANGARPMNAQTHTNTTAHPRTIGELFPSRWLKPEDLKRPALVAVASVDWPEVWDPSQKQNVIRPALRFSYRKADGTTVTLDKRLILNKTQALALAKITGTDELDGWIGANVVLTAGRAHTGAATIVISSAPAAPVAAPAHGDGERGEV